MERQTVLDAFWKAAYCVHSRAAGPANVFHKSYRIPARLEAECCTIPIHASMLAIPVAGRFAHACGLLKFRKFSAASRSISAPAVVCAAVKLPSRLAEKHASKAKQRTAKHQPAEPHGAQAAVTHSDKKKQKPIPLQQVHMRRPRLTRCILHRAIVLTGLTVLRRHTPGLPSACGMYAIRHLRWIPFCCAAEPTVCIAWHIDCSDRAVGVPPAAHHKSLSGVHPRPRCVVQPRTARSR